MTKGDRIEGISHDEEDRRGINGGRGRWWPIIWALKLEVDAWSCLERLQRWPGIIIESSMLREVVDGTRPCARGILNIDKSAGAQLRMSQYETS